ncbi:MAG TPA: ACP S-malonyltransferase [Candidatus Ozemobacteraceae bacterium]|nr:ACP S-malonyltransferase [Candidatus Ozemobacteraceae bacterium]
MKTAFVFPGQGSQKVGMASAMVQAYSWAAEMAARTDAVLGRPLTGTCFNGPEEALKQTVNTQPAIFFASALMVEAARREGVAFEAVAGHSLGEYAALYAAGVVEYDDLLRLVDARARAMETACPAGVGAMSAVLNLDRALLEEVCAAASDLGVCVVANYNCLGQLVISGAAAAVAKAGKLAAEKGARRVMPLDVSGPFHSPLMQPARDALAVAVEKVVFRDAKVPVYTNVDAAPTTSAAEFRRKLLEQLTGSVRWEDTIQRMVADGFGRFIELGTGKVLNGLIKKIAPAAELAAAGDPESFAALLGQAKAAS